MEISADICASTAAIHMISAFGTDFRLVLTQQKIVEKSNKFTTIPALLDLLDVTGNTITIDAMPVPNCEKMQDKGAIIFGDASRHARIKGDQRYLYRD